MSRTCLLAAAARFCWSSVCVSRFQMHLFSFKGDYENDLAPKHTLGGVRTNEALPVYLGVDIISFDNVDTVNMMFSVMLRLNITWRVRQ